MNKQELIEKFEEIGIYSLNIFGTEVEGIPTKSAIYLIEQLDEPQAGHAEEAPRYIKNILARLRELPLHDREVWLKAIMSEFEQDFSHAKWREGYEQGKFEGMVEREKVTIPQMVADIIEYYKSQGAPIIDVFEEKYSNEQYRKWLINEPNAYDIVALAWFFGYEVEKEKRYRVNVKNVRTRQGTLNRSKRSGRFIFSNPEENNLYDTKFTRKELEEAGFGWVFDC